MHMYFLVTHACAGDMLREAVAAGSPLGIEANTYMTTGALVPDTIIIGIVIARLNEPDCVERGWLLDGFPRTAAQADALQAAGIICDAFIQLDVDTSLLVERVVGRRSGIGFRCVYTLIRIKVYCA
jgi:adenylate kinase